MLFLLFLLPLATALAVMPWLKKAAVRYKFVDIAEGDELKIHKVPVSYLGGVGMLLGIGMGLILAGAVYPHLAWQFTGVYLAGFLVFAFGFWDDWKWKHITQRKPMQKLALVVAVQLGMAALLLAGGIRPEFVLSFIPSLLVSFGALFIISNAMNFQDGMDGLAGTLAAISLVGFLVLSLFQGLVLISLLSLIGLGAVAGFLRFNFPPASIFMGDSGAYLLGSLLAILVLLIPFLDTWTGLLGVIFLVGVPVFESFWSLGRRILGRTAFILGDRGHVYDILLQKGYPTRMVLAIFAGAQVFSVIAGILILNLEL